MREKQISLDETDWKILDALQENARATFTEIGQFVGLTAPPSGNGSDAWRTKS